ncbi:MAG: ECF transporter S component [Firmicutes bacterium]|nr:ECF transporter S component [Bacillota bacterium]
MRVKPEDSKVYHVVMTAMMMCIIMVAILLLRVPIPFTQGYVNLSDAMVFMAVIILGWKYGAVAAGLGSMLGDLLSGFAMWAPWSLGIKAVMAIIFGLIIQSVAARKAVSGRAFLSVEIVGMVIAGLFMAAAYFAAEGIMYGNWPVAALGIPWNIAQFVVGTILAVALNAALAKTSLRGHMAYAQPGR